MIRSFLTALISVIWLGSAFAATGEEWHIVDYVDPSTYEKVKAAKSENDEGYTIYIFRHNKGPVSWVFTLPAKSLDKLNEKVAAFYKIDNGPISEIEISSILPGHTVIGTQWVKSRIWHGEGVPTFGTMRKILDGSRLSIKFNIVGGNQVITDFDLSKASETISNAIGIPIDADKEEAQKRYQLSQVITDAFSVCMDINKYLEDKTYIDKCSAIAEKCTSLTTKSVDSVRDCMRDNGYPIRAD